MKEDLGALEEEVAKAHVHVLEEHELVWNNNHSN